MRAFQLFHEPDLEAVAWRVLETLETAGDPNAAELREWIRGTS